MACLNAGLVDVQKLMAGDAAGKAFTQIVVGTSNAPVTGTETALTGQVAKNILTTDYLPGGFVQFNATLDAGDPAMVIQEMGLLASDGTLVYRMVVSPTNKVTGVTYALSYKIQVQ